jgi:hypothetical protein
MAMVIGSGPGVAPDDSAGMELKPAISSLLRGAPEGFTTQPAHDNNYSEIRRQVGTVSPGLASMTFAISSDEQAE